MKMSEIAFVAAACFSLMIFASELKATQLVDARKVFCDQVAVSRDYDLKVSLRGLEADKATRLLGTQKGTRFLFVLPENVAKVTIGEVIRQSRLAEDITAILSELARTKDLKPREQCVIYTQEYKRSTIAIVVMDDEKPILSRKLIVGPKEHLYLSADLPVTNIKQLTYDSTTNTVQEEEKPGSFYFGLNYLIGDVFTDYPHNEFYNNLSIKVLLKASSHPIESYGLGLAYSLAYGDLFAASVWTQDEGSVPGTKPGRKQSFIAGISFNISKGIQWLKK